MSDENMSMLIMGLGARLGRFPTEEEVVDFINGTEEERAAIWAKGETNE